jgi:surface protein
MFSMFFECSSLTRLDLSSFDFSSVENISQMFSRCKSLSSFASPSVWPTNVREGINLFRVFYDCVKLKSVECPIVCISSFRGFRRVIEANSHF